MNAEKYKEMVVSKEKSMMSLLGVNGQRVKAYTQMLGLSALWELGQNARIQQARASFMKSDIIRLIRDPNNITFRIRLLRCHVFVILYYGTEVWTLTDSMWKSWHSKCGAIIECSVYLGWTEYVKLMLFTEWIKKWKHYLQ